MAIRMVCFDLGGVLVRICRSWAEGCRAAGLAVHEGHDSPDSTAARREAAHLHSTGRIDGAAYFQRLSHASGGLYTPADCQRVHQAWTMCEYPGVDRVVERLLRLPGVETGVLSNTNHEHWVRLEPNGAGSAEFPTIARLRHRFASHILGLAKPAPEFYREFERRTGFRGAEILFFDDLAENIDAARSLDWTAEQIDHAGDTAIQIEAHLRAHAVL